MSKTPETQSVEERYEALQSLCRQLIMVNETLKSELTRLSSVYQKAFSERSLLLDELVEHHSSCSAALKTDYSLGTSHQKRHSNATSEPPMPKKLRGLQSPAGEVKPPPPSSPQTRRPPDSVVPPHGIVECVSNLWSEQDPEDEFSPSSSETTLPSHSSGSHGLSVQSGSTTYGTTPASRWQSAEISKSPSAASLSMEASPSMSVFTTPQQQRPTKQPSLVTSSVVSSSGTGVSYIHSGPRSSLAGFQSVKNFPVVTRSVSIIQTSNVSRSVVPMSVVLSPTSPALLNTQSAIRGARTVQSPQTTASLRFTGPSSGQRIVIQPPSGNARSLLVQSSENVLSGLSGDFH